MAIKTRIQRQEGESFEQIWPVRCNDTFLTNKAMILGVLLVNTAEAMSYEPPTPPTDLPDGDDIEERPDDLPDDVPTKATITVKEINDKRYYYWQWREGEKVKSKYKSPVDPDE